jgi:DNA polymerase-3 subunit gamma/tau
VEYRALYRKYRPQRFGEIVGQDHITLTLAREVQSGKVAHAYLFAGPRGTGKTSTARIIAKSLNCADPGADGEPCNECASCVAITEGTSLDVIELDAASHNKVEDVREIRANVGTVASVGGAQRVYILDEAHMLSRAAANALLKTLEEPPEHAFFVLATTEPYKLPDTIRSRAQRFDFHPIGSELIVEHLGRIAKLEKYQATAEGLALIARHAKGSVRDALGLLEQVAALGSGKVEPLGVTRALGLVPAETYGRLARIVAAKDAPGALELVASIATEGVDLRRFVADGIEFFRGVFLALYTPNLEEIVDEPADVLAEWRTHARELEPADVLRTVDLLAEALVALREGREERLVVELTLLRLARPETSVDAASLAARLDRLERRVRQLKESMPEAAAAPAPAGSRRAAAVTAPGSKPAKKEARPKEVAADREAPPEPAEPPAGLDLKTLETAWPALVARVREEAGPRRFALFRECRPAGIDGATVVLEVPANLPFHLAQLEEDQRLAEIVARVATELLGGAVVVKYRMGDGEDAVLEAPVGESVEEATAPDKEQLAEAGEAVADPTAIVLGELGGEIVSDE